MSNVFPESSICDAILLNDRLYMLTYRKHLMDGCHTEYGVAHDHTFYLTETIESNKYVYIYALKGPLNMLTILHQQIIVQKKHCTYIRWVVNYVFILETEAWHSCSIYPNVYLNLSFTLLSHWENWHKRLTIITFVFWIFLWLQWIQSRGGSRRLAIRIVNDN